MAQLKKEITLASGIGLLSTTLLGTGLFMVPALAAGIAGPLSLWSWLLLLLGICPIALTFAQLGKRYPNAGGTAFFVRQAFNRRLEKSIAWLFLSVIPVGVPAAIALAAGFLQPLLPAALDNALVAQSITVVLLVLVNLSGTKSSGQLQTAIAISIFALVATLWWFGDISQPDIAMPKVTYSDWTLIGSALAVMFWCFVGIEAFAHMGEEFKNPQRDFPIAILVGCLVAGAAYWACSVVVIKYHAYGSSEFDTGSIPYLAQLLFSDTVKPWINVIGFVACFASINLYTQSLARMVWAQAREYAPSHRLANLSTNGVPANATLSVGAVLLLSCFISYLTQLDLEFFVKLANGVFILVYLMAMLAAVKLLHGFAKGLAVIALLTCAFMLAFLGWSMLYAVGLFALLMYKIKPDTKQQNEAQAKALDHITNG
ncbi:inner membrane protein YjeH [Vibrio ichthyoenteri ATCC 700023]|uniref:Inner membrane protein YjeH n=1 Tax=Vibrio ichthyoenteri ATCC 700023 TaxID=870968 RepID=F9S747_9VIBR|nr:L-methionine/branched-chain amino acid transporter [Vibrio ichthyoenteri]EGU32027.1 inner membrane protein YjeH [Vibrio ichthyoenteri ATCC 700023]